MNDADATPRDLYVKARALLDRFDREANPGLAIPLLERAVEKDPNFALGHATLTEAYRFRNQVAPDPQWLNLMSQSAQRAVKLNPELAAAYIAHGLALSYQKGKGAEAEAAFRQAIDLDPRSAAPYRWMAVSPNATKDQAAAHLERALALDPTNWMLLQEMGLLHYRAADYAQAATMWRKRAPRHPTTCACSQTSRRHTTCSIAMTTPRRRCSARSKSNRRRACSRILGTLRFFRGSYDEAIPPLEKAVALAPNRYLYWANLGDAYRWSPGHKTKAAEAYGQAIKMVRDELAKKPDDPDLQSRLALYSRRMGDKAAALEALQRLERMSPTQAVMLFRASVAYEVCGVRDKALTALEKATKAGYSEKEVRGEPELLSLRNDIRFHKISASLAASGLPAK